MSFLESNDHGRKSFTAYVAIRGTSHMLCCPTISQLVQLWQEVVKIPIDVDKIQKVIIIEEI